MYPPSLHYCIAGARFRSEWLKTELTDWSDLNLHVMVFKVNTFKSPFESLFNGYFKLIFTNLFYTNELN